MKLDQSDGEQGVQLLLLLQQLALRDEVNINASLSLSTA